ncbi:MAG: hypothetical protein VX938_05305, partial [Myxococcota bacterium]|nr:hypothetical protein [Myxococcota bacterium]
MSAQDLSRSSAGSAKLPALASPSTCFLVIMFLLMAVGCGDEPRTDGSDDAVKVGLVESAAIPAGEQCPAGGLEVRVGADVDGDNKLSDEEVASTDYVCDGEDGRTAMVMLAEEPAGEQCPFGGTHVMTGHDDDGDGSLAGEEVTGNAYVCDGAAGGAGAGLTMVLEDEEPGDNCDAGGVAIRAGVDADGDGELSPEETLSLKYICNGATGADGHTSLVALEDEEAGDNCQWGGVAVHSGIDTDGDGELGADEVTDTKYICNGPPGAGQSTPEVLEGDYAIHNTADVQALLPYTSVTGTLSILGGPAVVELPNLGSAGHLHISSPALEAMGLPALTAVGGGLEITGTALTTLDGLSALTSIG